MSYPNEEVPLVAGGSISRFTAIKFSSGKVVEVSAAGDQVAGLMGNQSADADGDAVSVQVEGVGKCQVDASTNISVGDDLMPTSGGKLAKHDGAGGSAFAGVALEAADADGDVIIVRLYGERQRTS